MLHTCLVKILPFGGRVWKLELSSARYNYKIQRADTQRTICQMPETP